jgi:hypothetical protein
MESPTNVVLPTYSLNLKLATSIISHWEVTLCKIGTTMWEKSGIESKWIRFPSKLTRILGVNLMKRKYFKNKKMVMTIL